MYSLPRNAHKLFVKMTQRTTSTRNSIYTLYHSTLCDKNASYSDPIAFHAQNDNVISWTSKVSSLVRKNKPNEAIGLFKTMLKSDQTPHFVTLLSLIKAVSALKCEDLIWVVHGLVIKLGFESEVPVVTSLLGCYSMYDMGIAWKLFDRVPSKDVVMWSAMVNGFVKNGDYLEAIELFKRMQCYGVEPNHVSVVSVLPACGGLGFLRFGKQIHGFCIKRVFYCYTNVRNSLVDMYAKCREFEDGVRVFDGVWNKDLISWRTMISGCIENKCPSKALSVFFDMQCSCFEADESIVRDTIVALLQADEIKFGVAFHCYVLKMGFLAFVSIGTALLQLYAKFNEVGSARKLFDQLNYKDLIAWSAMISVYAKDGQPYNAFDIFKHMQSTTEKPNEFTFVSLLQACSSMGAQELGESIHAHLIKVGYSLNSYLICSLIDLYCKFGRTKQAKTLFDEVPTKDLICWSSMINGYGLNGYSMEALETFANMLDCEVKPNDIVFLSVLSACSHCGLEYEGWNWFYCMEERYGIIPKLAHYACMVDLLSRRGNIEEALDFVKKMPVEPDKRIWGALLAGCRTTHGSIETAEFVVDRLSTLDPENTSYYVILLDLYAEEGRWEDVERLRRLVDEKELRKTMGHSITEAN